jgi:Tfp pilus assembly protein PilV
MKRKITNKLRAFTLVETLFSIMLFGVCAVALLQGVIFGIHRLHDSRMDSRATQILTEQTELMRLCTWGEVQRGARVFRDGDFIGTVKITNDPMPVSYCSGLCRFDVTVAWMVGRTPHERTWSTYCAKNGLNSYVICQRKAAL